MAAFRGRILVTTAFNFPKETIPMKPITLRSWEALCRRALRKPLGECAPEMLPALTVAEALYPLLHEVGPRGASGQALLDAKTESVIEGAFQAICETGSFAPLLTLEPEVRDTFRDFLMISFTAIMLTSDQGLMYGPVPKGLRRRDLALAALAIEVLESRSPQRLLAQHMRRRH
jgi:hypothetical protein